MLKVCSAGSSGVFVPQAPGLDIASTDLELGGVMTGLVIEQRQR